MMRKLPVTLGLMLLCAVGASAQVTVRGQFLLPGGDVPREPIRFNLNSGDGRINDIRFSDSNGRFILERLDARIDFMIFVNGDGSTYADTSHSFVPAYNNAIRVTLNAIVRRNHAPATVSAGSSYRPPKDASEAHQAALREIEKQKFDVAEVHLRKAIAIDPKFTAALTDLGALLMQQKRYPEAEHVLAQSLQVDPKSTLALLNMGITLNRQGKFSDAIPHLREALRLEPRLVAGYLHLGIALVETEQFEEAERALLRATRSPGPEEVVAQLYLGKLYARTGEWAKGIAALEAYLEKAPTASNAEDVRALLTRLRQEMAARK